MASFIVVNREALRDTHEFSETSLFLFHIINYGVPLSSNRMKTLF